MRLNLLIVALVIPFLMSWNPQPKTKSTPRIAFYNVENLFDTVDDPTPDDDFTPDGRQRWTSERYDKKIKDIAKVVEAMGLPSIMGFCEVEHKQVVADILQQAPLSSVDYEIAHFESSDYRGIDVALIYDTKRFKLIESKAIPVDIPDEIEPDYTTRDFLYVKGKFKGEVLHIFVNHWPSRRGGLRQSEPKRLFVAKELRKQLDAVFAADKHANIVLMGDFNDETTNESIRRVLQAQPMDKVKQATQLYNCFSEIDAAAEGSYNYKGNWNMLDQIIVSTPLMDGKGWEVQNPTVFKASWMIYKSDRNGNVPNRTYGGPNYYGGISDHFPVYVDLVKE